MNISLIPAPRIFINYLFTISFICQFFWHFTTIIYTKFDDMPSKRNHTAIPISAAVSIEALMLSNTTSTVVVVTHTQ